MADRIEPTENTTPASMLGPSGERLLAEFVKETFNETVEKPYNLMIKGINYFTGENLPKLNITGIEDRPPKPVKFIKA